MFYNEILLYEDVQWSISLIAHSVQHQATLEEASIINQAEHNITKQPQVFAELYTASNNDIKIVDHGTPDETFKAFDHEYWMEYLDFDDATVRMCYQGNAD